MVLIFYVWENPQICRYLENSNIYVPFTSLKNYQLKANVVITLPLLSPFPFCLDDVEAKPQMPCSIYRYVCAHGVGFRAAVSQQPGLSPLHSQRLPLTAFAQPTLIAMTQPALCKHLGLQTPYFLFLLCSSHSLLCLLSSCKVCDAACKYPSHVDNRCPNSKLHHPMLA